MDKFPLLYGGRPLGELTAEREALYTWFDARCVLPGEGLWCAWAVGDQGELRLGVLEPRGDRASIRRRFSDRLTAPLGRIQWGEIRAAHPAAAGEWAILTEREMRTFPPRLRRELAGTSGILFSREGERRLLAAPYDPARPFPLERFFCFARVRRIGGRSYAVYAFDGGGHPAF